MLPWASHLDASGGGRMASEAGEGRFDRELNDDELALLFAVCHPVLSPEMRVTFALSVSFMVEYPCCFGATRH